MGSNRQPFTSRSVIVAAEDMASFGYWWKDLRTSHEFWSPGMYRMLGLTPSNDQIVISRLLDRVHPSDRQLMSTIISSEAHHIPVDSELRLFRNSGTLCWIGLRSRYIYSPEGAASFVFYMAVDITDRKKAIESLNDQDRRFASLANSFKFVLYRTSPDGEELRIQNWSALGLPSETVFMDGKWIDDVHHDDVPRVSKYWQECMSERKAGSIRYRRTSTINGALLDMIFYFQPVFAATGEVCEWTGVGIRMGDVGSSIHTDKMIAGVHVRAARALLGWSLEELAARSAVSVSSIRRLENGPIILRSATISILRQVLEVHGIEFSCSPSGAPAVALKNVIN